MAVLSPLAGLQITITFQLAAAQAGFTGINEVIVLTDVISTDFAD
jgi:hypothetical protein